MSNDQSAQKIPMPCKAHFKEIQQFLAECRVKRQVTFVKERGNVMTAAIKDGQVVYLVDEKGCAHFNAGHNLRAALVKTGWKDCVEAIFRVGTRQSVFGDLSWAPHICGTSESPIRIPDFAAIDAAKAEAEAATSGLAPVIPITPQQ